MIRQITFRRTVALYLAGLVTYPVAMIPAEVSLVVMVVAGAAMLSATAADILAARRTKAD